MDDLRCVSWRRGMVSDGHNSLSHGYLLLTSINVVSGWFDSEEEE